MSVTLVKKMPVLESKQTIKIRERKAGTPWVWKT
jgi:hypothetical protein